MLKRVVTRRLPGFRFEAESPLLAEALPRMDVACFVGFAASGPLHVPVAIESVAQFESIFGKDAPLAWDAVRGTQVFAYLAPAVRSFLANGGRRCWVIRVARTLGSNANGSNVNGSNVNATDGSSSVDPFNFARANFFPIPGMARAVVGKDGEIESFAPAFARARSEGSWSDALEVSAALLTSPAQVASLSLADLTLRVNVDAPDDISAGDLLRLTFKDGLALLLVVARVEAATDEDSPPGQSKRRAVNVVGKYPLWLRTTHPDSVADKSIITLNVFTSEPLTSPPRFADASDGADAFAASYTATLRVPKKDELSAGDATLSVSEAAVEVTLALESAPAPGSVVRVEYAGGLMLLTVESVGILSSQQGSDDVLMRLAGRAHWLLAHAASPPDDVPPADELPAGERLTFELRVRKAGEFMMSVGDLAFGAEAARFWGQLPTDEQVYRTDETAPVNAPAEQLWQPLGVERFPLASTGERNAIYFPLAMPPLADQFLGAVRLQGDALERDGLAEFNASLFLDASLADATASDLLPRADLIRYLGAQTRPLTGLHAALSVEEATIICAPDAIHRGWFASDREEPRLPTASRPFPRPEWWHFRDCREMRVVPLARTPKLGHFLNCGVRPFPRPHLTPEKMSSETGTYTLAWQLAEVDPDLKLKRFVLEESGDQDFTNSTEVYAGAQQSQTFYGCRTGDYYYRVRAEFEIECDARTHATRIEKGDWSNGAVVRVRASTRWHLKDETDYDAADLLAVQRALVRLCAARADLVAVLSLPAHYREDKSLEHAATFKRTAVSGERVAARVPTFNGGEAFALSYCALYHPWLTGRDPFDVEKFRAIPPDGAACGVIARRTLARGAWIAPANELFDGVVALTPPVVRTRWLDLQLAQINLIRQEPRGFLALNADTLSAEEDLRELSVRRLLILLRRICLQHGTIYVFEPNSPAFRRLVQRGFEGVLDQLYERGAFAGATASTSYRVVTDEALNTPESVELGRFIVELRVAPSQPLTFMTIRLVQTGDRGFVTEVRPNG
jgi:hypothetical protein